MRLKKKIIIYCLIISIVFSMSGAAVAINFDIKAESAILMEAKTGQILFSKNDNNELPPASMTKTMTLLLAMEAIDAGEISLNDEVIVSELAASMGGSQIYLAPGEKMKVETLLKSIAIASANDACVAIAEYIGGTEASFVEMMNQKVKELGLKHTNFVNTTGLPTEDGDHYSSPFDMAVIARKLINKHPKVLEWTDIWMDKIRDGEFTLYNTNKLLNYYPGTDGLKTGWTDEAGFCLTATAKRDNMRLISVVMQTDSEETRMEESAKLLSYGFSRFNLKEVINKGKRIKKVKVEKGEKLEVGVETADNLKALVKTGGEKIEQQINLAEKVIAPIDKGQKLGELVVAQGEKEIGSVDLVATEKIKKAGILTRLLRIIKRFLLGFFK